MPDAREWGPPGRLPGRVKDSAAAVGSLSSATLSLSKTQSSYSRTFAAAASMICPTLRPPSFTGILFGR